jgi:Flp pilus assembly protein TadG
MSMAIGSGPVSGVSRRRRRGASATEFALMLPMILVFLAGAIDFCRMFYQYTIVTECARNGAMYASDLSAQATSPYTVAGNQAASITAAALADAGNLSPAPTVTFSPNPVTSSTITVQVTVTYPFTPVTSYIWPGTYNVSRTIQMTVAPQ